MTWAEIAAANGKAVHPGMQLNAIASDPSLTDITSATGRLERGPASTLAAVLARNTDTPDRCYLAVWEGYGGLPRDVRAAPAFTLPHRRYHLLTGAVESVRDDVFGSGPHYQSPNLWWPEDRAWCVATEIDLHSTYVACSAQCAAEIVAADGVEALPIPHETGIAFDSDAIN